MGPGSSRGPQRRHQRRRTWSVRSRGERGIVPTWIRNEDFQRVGGGETDHGGGVGAPTAGTQDPHVPMRLVLVSMDTFVTAPENIAT